MSNFTTPKRRLAKKHHPKRLSEIRYSVGARSSDEEEYVSSNMAEKELSKFTSPEY